MKIITRINFQITLVYFVPKAPTAEKELYHLFQKYVNVFDLSYAKWPVKKENRSQTKLWL